jgi:hypothetical protein
MPSHQERVRRNYDPQEVVKSLAVAGAKPDADTHGRSTSSHEPPPDRVTNVVSGLNREES